MDVNFNAVLTSFMQQGTEESAGRVHDRGDHSNRAMDTVRSPPWPLLTSPAVLSRGTTVNDRADCVYVSEGRVCV